MSDTSHSDGRRTIGLYIPYPAAGVTISAITLAPSTWGHLLRWQGGVYLSALDLLRELAGVELHVLELLRHPDDARVMAAFLDHVQPAIAEDIRNGVRPLPGGDPTPEPQTPVYGAGGATEEASAPEVPGYGPGYSAGSQGDFDPLSSDDGFTPVPSERPRDYVEGLDD